MENNIEPKLISDEIQNCFSEIFLQACQDCNNNYSEILTKLTLFLRRNTPHEYDNILKRYPGVTKDLLKIMLFSNFVEFNYYRHISNVPLDSLRLKSIQIIEKKKAKGENILNYITNKGAPLYKAILNDVLIYFNHFSKTIAYNAVKSAIATGYADNIYSFYSFARLEHLITLNDNLTAREKLLGTLLECIVLSTEKNQFSLGITPTFNEYYKIAIDQILKVNYSVYPQIIESFKEKVDLSTENCRAKKELLEILFLVMDHRSSEGMSLGAFESNFLKNSPNIMTSPENIAKYFSENEDLIMTGLIRNWTILMMDYVMDATLVFPENKDLRRKKEKE